MCCCTKSWWAAGDLSCALGTAVSEAGIMAGVASWGTPHSTLKSMFVAWAPCLARVSGSVSGLLFYLSLFVVIHPLSTMSEKRVWNNILLNYQLCVNCAVLEWLDGQLHLTVLFQRVFTVVGFGGGKKNPIYVCRRWKKLFWETQRAGAVMEREKKIQVACW